jgi:hypothetical protein
VWKITDINLERVKKKQFEDTIGLIRSVNRRSDNTMAKRLNNDPQTHRKLDIEQHEPHQKPGVNSSCASEGKQFLFHMWHPLFYYCYIPGDKS